MKLTKTQTMSADLKEPSVKQKASFNIIRSNKISTLKRKNYKLSSDLRSWMATQTFKDGQDKYLYRLDRDISRCATTSLYRQDIITKQYEYMASHTCDNKNCNVCNYNRQKRIRRKYWNWFKDNKELVEYVNVSSKKKMLKVTTKKRWTDLFESDKKYLQTRLVEYDLMSLTLTVPHQNNLGFQGQKHYFDKIQKLFWLMRKNDEWLELVYGGEYGIEVTRGGLHKKKLKNGKQKHQLPSEYTSDDNGLHIHIHGLLMVKRCWQSRNLLHKFILKEWNKLTVDDNSSREAFSLLEIEAIKKGNKSLTDLDIQSMNPHGATFISLANIFVIDKKTKAKTYDFNSDAMLMAVMETISYHFEPQCFDKEDKSFDFPLLADVLPHIYGRALYKKFGCLHGEKPLNIKYSSKQEELLDDLSNAIECDNQNILVDEETGEIIASKTYFICNPAYVYHFGEGVDMTMILSNKARDKTVNISADNLPRALDQMLDIVLGKMKKEKKLSV